MGFAFCAAVVGPIPKEDYLDALGNFKLEDSFDIEPNYFGWNVDPMQTNRVWFMGRSIAKHTGTFEGVEATGKELIMPPQQFHLDFNEEGLVKEIGFYTVDLSKVTLVDLEVPSDIFMELVSRFPSVKQSHSNHLSDIEHSN